MDGRPPTDIKQLLLVPRKTKMRPLFLLFLLFLGFSRVRNGNLQYFTTSYSAFEATHVAIVECAATAICIEITTSPLPNPDTHAAAHPPSIRELALRSVLPPCYLSIDSSSPPPPPPSPPRTNLSHVFAVQSIAVQALLSLPISEREKEDGRRVFVSFLDTSADAQQEYFLSNRIPALKRNVGAFLLLLRHLLPV